MKKTPLLVGITLIAISGAALAFPPPHGPMDGPIPSFFDPAFLDAFSKQDANHQGAITKDQLSEMVKTLLNENKENQALLKDFATADADKNGFVTLDELVKVIPAPKAPEPPKEARSNDKPHHDGMHKRDQGNKTERHHGMPGPHHGPHHGGPEFNPTFGLLGAFDADHDFKLNQKEYEAFYKDAQQRNASQKEAIDALKNADLNGDGFVTIHEMCVTVQGVMLKHAPQWKTFEEK